MTHTRVRVAMEYAPDDVRGAELLVLVALAASADGDHVAVGVDVLARQTRLDEGTVRNALSTLARRALIVRTRHTHAGAPQRYRLTSLGPWSRR